MTDEKPRDYAYAGKLEEAARLEAQAIAYGRVLEKELEIMNLKPGMKVLDAGCGTGAISRMIAQKVSPGEVYGIDIDPVFISEAKKLAKKKGIENIEFELDNVDDLKFDNNTFDVVYCRLVLMHVKNPVKTVIELKRATKKNGFIAVSDNDDGSVLTYPPMPKAMGMWTKFGELAETRGEDRYIGRKLFSILSLAGLASIKIFPIPWFATQETPELLKMFVSVPVQIIESSKEALISQGYTTAKEYEEGMNEAEQLLIHPRAFAMTCSFLAIGKVP